VTRTVFGGTETERFSGMTATLTDPRPGCKPFGILDGVPSDELRDRIVREAGRLFYREGVGATGVNRVASELGVSKRTLYELFDTKSELYAGALDAFDARAFTGPAEARSDDPEEQLLGLFAVLATWMADPGFRGCPYLNAAHELADPDDPARAVAARRKAELRTWIERRARAAGLRRPRALAEQLAIVVDGALAHATVATVDRDTPGRIARTLIEAARPA
jgi:AcrR family transcriptional regulator